METPLTADVPVVLRAGASLPRDAVALYSHVGTRHCSAWAPTSLLRSPLSSTRWSADSSSAAPSEACNLCRKNGSLCEPVSCPSLATCRGGACTKGRSAYTSYRRPGTWGCTGYKMQSRRKMWVTGSGLEPPCSHRFWRPGLQCAR